jgi:hypothetical protein
VSGFTGFISYKNNKNDSYYDNMSVKIPKNIIYLHFLGHTGDIQGTYRAYVKI